MPDHAPGVLPPDAPVHWLVQTDLGPSSGVDDLLTAVRAQHHGLTLIRRHPPMSTEPPAIDLPAGALALVYGTANLVEQVARHRPWSPGVWFEPERFTYTAWARHYGPHLLNDPAQTHQVTLTQALEQGTALAALREPDVFVRPEHDLKAFSGAVWEPAAFLAWARDAVDGRIAQVGPGTPIVIAPAHGIAAEWRVVVSDRGEVLGSSQYRARGRLKVVPDTPDEVLEFARDRAVQWSPAPVFVLDVARSGDGLYVVEAQCAHCAGFYAMDVAGWVRGMSAVARRWALDPTPVQNPSAPEDSGNDRTTVPRMGTPRRLR